ncbi:SAVED domain-containing protein [Deinococcus sp. SL84]|uniref:SAVED domain-containing protein n=1 Tax=Deinococcus sp. SL84 TaxID=2994663 RepID=UPI002273877F|nr:SAVED domain-containing protein [Deinococcus sp. SL84]MCY1704277.1 SAVED domain-containing protein [Deinococcus sp. SL84]
MARRKEAISISTPATVKAKKKTYQKPLGRKKPPQGVVNELWARAAGRCEFQGCNELLYLDEITGKRHNGATIAHIVAYSPDGPRGDIQRSEALRQEISNLMLTCKLHGSLIDNLAYVDQFTEEVLLGFKESHETRIREATAALDDQKTTLLLLQGRIAGRVSHINLAEVQRAIQPRWPGSENETTIDLNDYVLGEDRASYWDMTSEKIRDEVKALLKRKHGQSHLSIFAMAPIPLLVLLGFELGSRIDGDIFQYHREKQINKWCWSEGDSTAEDSFDIYKPKEVDATLEDIALVISITRQIQPDLITNTLAIPHARYEIRARKTGTDFLKYRSQLTVFAAEYRQVMKAIGETFPKVKRIHLFLAGPVASAIEAGRNLIEKADPELVVYELRGQSYLAALRLNTKETNR